MSENVRKRGIIKAKLTMFTKYVDALDNNVTELEIFQLKERLAHIDLVKCDFEAIQSCIELSATEETLSDQLLERENFEKQYFSKVAEVKKMITDFQTDNISETSSRASVNVLQSVDHLSQIKLPTINLPKFEGSYQTWIEYRDTYRSLIHENQAISAVQKFHYLKASLLGAAAEVIKSLEISAANYEIAWMTLSERYDNDKLLIHNHVKILFNCEPIIKESAGALRKLFDNVSKNLRALEQLNQPVKSWDTLLLYLISTKLDSVTLREWENCKKDIKDPTFDDLQNFIKSRANLLEMVSETHPDKRHTASSNTRGFLSTGAVQNNQRCVFCKKEHYVQNCAEFLKLSIKDRIDKARYIKVCLNCLRGGHNSKVCRRSGCTKCESKHHTLLHLEQRSNTNTSAPTDNRSVSVDKGDNRPPQNTEFVLSACSSVDQVFLSTVFVQITDNNNKSITIRALLDCGAQSSFITRELRNRLKIHTSEVDVTVKGINGICSNITGKCELKVQALHSAYSFTNNFFIIDTISHKLPVVDVNVSQLNIPKNLTLADPYFYKAEKIDMLIGADIFWQLICVGQISLGRNKPILQKTKFGWVVSGAIGSNEANQVICNFIHHTNDESDINKILTRFWDIENIESDPIQSLDDSECEKHFIENFQRNTDGRFIVRLPLKLSTNLLGDSYNVAYKRFINLERRLESKPKLKQMYSEFLSEYLQLGHMKKIDLSKSTNVTYYIPHRGVLREESLTTKLRVVFDASSPTSSGYSLNNLQYIGPTLQQDLFSILIRFRQHKYVISADVAKMYRQVLVCDEQRPLQRILWRKDPSQPVDVYELKTVTYGTSSASFLSTRCLFQLAIEHEQKSPELSKIIKSDFYVDDLLTGADSLEEAARICSGVSDILKQGCFELRKFYSNEPEVLKYVHGDNSDAMFIEFGENENAKTLGITWMPKSDLLAYKINSSSPDIKITKRSILSSIAQIFDPLGLLAPSVILAKVLLQRLWLEKVTWDESLPTHIHTFWHEYNLKLAQLNNIRISRRVLCSNAIEIQMHGFSDASETAYGACIYIRSLNSNGQVVSHLLCAKSKVAPLKTVTIPRLELTAALLLTKLAQKVRASLRLSINRTIFWTDSSIVLGWLKAPPNTLKTFVSNRVAEIQNLTSSDTWRHVRSGDNPADIVSRGVKPECLITNNLWWHGPCWLKESEDSWPQLLTCKQELPDTKKRQERFLFNTCVGNSLIKRFSSLTKLKKVTAWIFRFYKNCRLKTKGERINSNFLNIEEINSAFLSLIGIDQHIYFNSEISRLYAGKTIDKNSKLLSLNPFIDESGFLRVGGRLANSKFPFEKKYPMILDSKSHLTALIAYQIHIDTLHAGPQHMLATIRQNFWPIGGRLLVKSVVRKCLACYRYRPKTVKPIMAALPENRTNSRQPFEVTGVDYCGPLLIKSHSGRGCKIKKAYTCIFICSVTKAIHIELVTDLTKECFLLALKRFTSRRGLPSYILSDNGTNFVAARNELRELGKFMVESNEELLEHFHKNNINWRFNPPCSPHFGGLWEAGVKSIKYHFRRVTKGVALTFEQSYTLLTQVEAILNSRPLSPLSNSIHDLNPLTPSHFLIGGSSTMVPEADLLDVPSNRLTLFQHLTQLKQHLWDRWSKEYVTELQTRTKWKQHYSSLKAGALVLIKEDNLPPLKWKLGRVHAVHEGPDGVSRVATINTQNGLIKRSFTKICPLPMSEDECANLGTSKPVNEQ